MQIRELAPLRDNPKDWDEIEKRIRLAFQKLLYIPILEELNLPADTIQNAKDTLVDAIRKGRVTFKGRRFRGKFSAEITKELRKYGAIWDAKNQTFLMRQGLPPDLVPVVAASEARFADKLKALDQKLEKILPEEIAEAVKVSELFDRNLWKVDKQVEKTLKGISIPPNLTSERRERLATEWQNNLTLYIKDFATEEIQRLRQQILQNTFAGTRRENLIKTIEKSYGVTRNKAKFLARQETSLLMAKFKETRYQEAGVYEYKWRCVAGSKNHPVRPSHKILDGKIYSWDNPPCTTAPGEPVRFNNPGTDYGCRCSAIPVVRFKKPP